MLHGVTFNFGSAGVWSPPISETLLLYVLLHNCAISIDSYSPINKFSSLIFFSLLIDAVILLLNCLVLVLYLYIHFLSLRCYFLYLNIIWTFIRVTLR